MSTRAKVSKGKGKKGKDKMAAKRSAVSDLTEQNEALLRDKESLQEELGEAAGKLSTVVHTLVDSLDEKVRLKKFHITKDMDHMKVETSVLVRIIEYLAINRQQQEVSVAARIDDLEARVTSMSMDIARMTMKTMAYESGFSDFLKCRTVDEVQDRVHKLQFIANQEYQLFAVNDPDKSQEAIIGHAASRISLDSDSRNETARILNLEPPLVKSPGDTHIKSMDPDLRVFIMKDMSQERQSRADWRTLAMRVGIDADTIGNWEDMKLSLPMGKVDCDVCRWHLLLVAAGNGVDVPFQVVWPV